MRILIAEDSPTLGRDLRDALVRDGHVVDLATDGEQAMHFLASFSYDVVTLDLMMPRADGWTVLRSLRDRPDRPRVLVLSARGQVEDRVDVLNLGADDFMVKPFAYAELLARLHALMRRGESAPVLLGAGRLVVDPRARTARVGDTPLPLSPKEYALLEMLLTHRGRVLSRTALFEGLYDARSEASDKVIEVLVSTLRAKLAQAGIEQLIETRRGFGYVVAA
ncbi:response regulator transcription factor [Dyella lutea]|uniref:Response regulator transcription factor n=1 Tax=Dyella lutea TaxID=2950441 RepID=A0ABT1F5N6_9GAMM|nr:response regulator transcription factor [Dyella lutea]MCP1372455.1 response regulator transcription factor [Dyella lutea]